MNRNKRFKIELISETQDEVTFDCGDNELVLDAAKGQGIFMANYCKQGACGACTAKLVSGAISYVRSVKGLSQTPQAGEDVRPCSLNPCSNVVLEPLSEWRLSGG